MCARMFRLANILLPLFLREYAGGAKDLRVESNNNNKRGVAVTAFRKNARERCRCVFFFHIRSLIVMML